MPCSPSHIQRGEGPPTVSMPDPQVGCGTGAGLRPWSVEWQLSLPGGGALARRGSPEIGKGWWEGRTDGAVTSSCTQLGAGDRSPTLSSATIYLLSLFDQAPSHLCSPS